MSDNNSPHNLRVDEAVSEHRSIEDAVTPISGAHSVPRTARPTAHHETKSPPRRNWQGIGVVVIAILLFAAALVAFIMWKGPAWQG